MSLLNYGVLIREDDDEWSVTLTDSLGWNVVAESWTWELRFSKSSDRETLVLSLTAISAVISGGYAPDFGANPTMTLLFQMTGAQSASLTPETHYVDVKATEADGTVHFFEPAHGRLVVRDPEGSLGYVEYA